MGDVRNWPRNAAGQIILTDPAESAEAPDLRRIYEETRSAIAGAAPPAPPAPPARPAHLALRMRWLAALVTLTALVGLTGLALLLPARAPAPSAAPSPSPTRAPTATVMATPAPVPALDWAVDAYDAQRHYVGQLAAGRSYELRDTSDAAWLQIRAPAWNGAPDSGAVWIRAIDLIRPPTRYGPTPTPPDPPTAEPQAPAYQPPAAPRECQTMAERDAAPYRVTRPVVDARGVERGSVTGFSCVSAAAAEAHAAAQETQLQATIAAQDAARRPTAAP